jgi:hypothetical protein
MLARPDNPSTSARWFSAVALALLGTLAAATNSFAQPATPQSLFPQAQPGSPATPGNVFPGASQPPPDGAVAKPSVPGPVTAVPPGAGPGSAAPALIPPGLGSLAVSARFGREATSIGSGLHWRVYPDKPDQTGIFRLIKEDRSASPTFALPPGGYIVHVAFGLANTAKRLQVRAEPLREVFDIPAGGARFEGRVGDTKVGPGQITFDIFKGGQFETGEKRPIATEIGTGDVVLLPEGVYHVASNYGDGNAVMRYDFRVQAGKLTDARINHRAAVITLKLVGERGGEALANTAWSVLTPGGDVIKESIGAFPTVVLAEGDYVAIARNEGKVFNREFKVEPGFDREIELVAR